MMMRDAGSFLENSPSGNDLYEVQNTKIRTKRIGISSILEESCKLQEAFMEYKVEDLLKIPFLKNATVLSGKSGMQRNLNWYRELRADQSGEQAVRNTNADDILILADTLNAWDEDQLSVVVQNAASYGAGCIVMFSDSSEYRFPQESLQIAEAADLPVIVVVERRLPVEILSREIAMILLQNSRNSSYLQEVFLAQTGEKELSQSDFQVIRQCSGYDFAAEHVAVCIGFDDRKNTPDSYVVKNGLSGKINDFCMDWLNGKSGQIIAGITEQSFILFLPVVTTVYEAEQQMCILLSDLAKNIGGIEFRAGMGTPQIGIDKWKRSLKEAKLALRAMRIFQWEGVRTVWKTQPAAMLLDIRDHKQLYLLRNPVIKPLYSAGTQDAVDGELAHTLEMFFRYGRNRSLTAEKMFLHRNTLNLRLRKIEKICGVDLTDPVRCRELEFAIYVEKCLLLG